MTFCDHIVVLIILTVFSCLHFILFQVVMWKLHYRLKGDMQHYLGRIKFEFRCLHDIADYHVLPMLSYLWRKANGWEEETDEEKEEDVTCPK